MLILGGCGMPMGVQARRDLFQGRGADIGTLQSAILYLLNPRLDRRVLDWSSGILLLQRLE